MSPPLSPDSVSVKHDTSRPDDERFRAPVEPEALARGLAARSPSRVATALRITEAVNRETALIAGLDVLVSGVREALGADSVAVMLVEESPDGPVLVMHASRGRAPDLPPSRVAVGRGVLGRIAERRETMLLDNVQRLGDMPATAGGDQIASLLGVPVTDERRLIGVLYVGSKSAGAFGDDDRHLLELSRRVPDPRSPARAWRMRWISIDANSNPDGRARGDHERARVDCRGASSRKR
jgi:putative methionine-R-sulfoxide reductase with GAF domain